MPTLNATEMAILKFGEELLSREVRFCDVRHEDVQRNAQGDVQAPIGFVRECSYQYKHFGCPHYLEQAMDGINAALYLLFRHGDERCNELKEELRSIADTQQILDTRIRDIRTGTTGNIVSEPIPHAKDAKEKVKGYLNMFNAQCILLDTLRREALGKLQDALHSHFASPETDE